MAAFCSFCLILMGYKEITQCVRLVNITNYYYLFVLAASDHSILLSFLAIT